MEAAAGVAASRGVSLPMVSSQPSRKEWRAVSEHLVRNSGNEDLEHLKLGQSDERTIYEQGREPADVDFCSVMIAAGGLDNEIVQQRLCSVARHREELQQMEIELQAQFIVGSEIMEMQNSFDAQIKEHANANIKLQEQLHEKEHRIHELERKIEDKERELRAIKLDNEAAWAKEDLLREQNKELATFRRERDNSEAERAQHLKQIHDFQEHVQEKERIFMELQEQNRVSQEAILIKEEQLREAQAWIRRVQEMDALQSTTNHSLQAELRERTDQYNQLWLGCQRQFTEMERHHMHAIQQLQIELANARERIGICTDESHVSQENLKDVSQFGQNNGSRLDVNGNGTPDGSSGVFQHKNTENISSFVSAGTASNQTNHVPGVPLAPSSLLGMPTYLPPGQVTALHPFVVHQQGVPHSVPSNVTQSHGGHFHSVVPTVSSIENWQNQQAVSEGLQMLPHNQYPPSETEQNLLRPDNNYDCEVSLNENGQALHPNYLDVHVSQGMEPDSMIPSSAEERQVLESLGKICLAAPRSEQSLQHTSSQFHDVSILDALAQSSETKEKSVVALTSHGLEGQGLTAKQESSAFKSSSSDSPNHATNFSEAIVNNVSGSVFHELFVSSEQHNMHSAGKTSEVTLLDERSLLACIVRTIPPGSGGKIKISSTLPNRLAKMLAPLHWHDYKKTYGKLEDFVAGHPELFVITGDYIHLREGAQGMIAATAAVAKVAAATAASSPHSSLLPSVAVTPMAQSHRLKRAPSIDSNSVKTDKTIHKEYAAHKPTSVTDDPSQHLVMHNQHPNGVSYNVAGGISNIKILSKPKDPLELNGLETRPGILSGVVTVGNGANTDRIGLGGFQSKGSTNGRPTVNSVGKQLGRTTGAASTSRR
ncbi:uncharacterized protein LOC132271552 isoform X2 [Cornus florida]|uniref:uncharacterized protein LOC132271552 isoform X2 n=1 Tax=Cornus florida TaxID=4283 RepID=UPI00289D4A57|nr:uncharacterized protein LOC132271552 isoform X2 [Cornus florida]